MRRAVCALLTVVLVAACSSPDGSTTGSATSIVIGAGSEPENLNPVLGYAPDGAAKIFDGLVSRDASLALKPALADGLPTASADGLTWTAKLRKDITFSDGTPLTAQDVVFTYKSVLDKKVNSTIATRFDAVTDVVAVDTGTVEFTLSHAYAPFPQQLTLGIVPAAKFAGVDVNSAPFNTAPIGTGPYTVAEWRKGDRLVLKANEKYWGGAPAIKTVTVVFVPDDNARATRMAAGEFDGTVLPPKLARSYVSKSGYRLVQNPSADYRGLGIPSELPFTSDPRVRRAINLGINRQAMIDAVLAGSGKPAATPISPHLKDWYDPSATFAFDTAEAARLLDEAGWRKGADGKRARDGQPARLPVLYPAPDVLRKELALAAASDIAKLGIDAPVEATTFEVMLQRRGEAASVWGGGEPYDPDTAAYTLLHSRYAGQQGYVNMTLYRNSTVDTALDTGRRSLDPGVRKQAYQDFQRAYVNDPGWAFLVFLDHTYVLRDKWNGQETQVEPHDHGLVNAVWWNLERWTPKP
ncbi:peptide/nickel transport system substrate-binding protein [Lentzea xinjiangensis]|uniref:Peptide/nickel transport system substrate-binding protein n=1 Tax=Lentzea xinjiangensis TaxID=402600 RepID=A0A1H9JLU2_9PSEU|nr:ABC transporter substrate-binding protein [Lentzea xinjiangensis]SEQ87713.1 peptide/nickel transport system substrate-binding protein [Lentzea xinjiangensis]